MFKSNLNNILHLIFLTALLFLSFSGAQNTAQVEKNKNSIVFLLVEGTNPNTGSLAEAQATGFVLCESGYVLTAKHTIDNLEGKGYTEEINIVGSVRTGEEISKRRLEIIKEDQSDDLLLLKFRGELPANTIPVTLSNGDRPKDASLVYSLGFPADLSFTDLTTKVGHISGDALGRQGHWLVEMNLRVGDSGSPIFNVFGQVVATVKGGFNEVEDLKEIIPISFANELIEGIPCNISREDPPETGLSAEKEKRYNQTIDNLNLLIDKLNLDLEETKQAKEEAEKYIEELVFFGGEEDLEAIELIAEGDVVTTKKILLELIRKVEEVDLLIEAATSNLQKEIDRLNLDLEQARQLKEDAKRYIEELLLSGEKENLKAARLIAEGDIEAAKGVLRELIERQEEQLELQKEQLELQKEMIESTSKELSKSNLNLARLEIYDNPPEALKLLQKAVLYDENNLEALNQLGQLRSRLGKPHEAIESFEKIRELAEEQDDKGWLGTSLGNLGNAYLNLGQYQQAIDYYEQALEIFLEIGDRQGEGNTLGNLGNAYNDLGQYQQAIGYYEQALEISLEIGDRQGEGASLGNLGNVYRNLGQYQQAIDYYGQALDIALEIGNRQGEGDNFGNLGIVYSNLEQYQQAIDYHEQVLEIALEIGDRQGEGAALGNLGNAYLNLGQYP